MKRSGKKTETINTEMALYIGESYNSYYKRKWEKLNKSSRKFSFNLSSFFLLNLWLAYRKMHGFAYGIVALSFALQIVTPFLPLTVARIAHAVFILLWVITALLSNHLLQKQAIKKISAFKEQFPNKTERLAYIKGHGGGSEKSVWVLICVALASQVLLQIIQSFIQI